MTNENVQLMDGDPTNVKLPGNDSGFIFKIPEADKPLVCKLVRDMRSAGKRAYTPITYYSHKIGPSDKDTRTHPSHKSLDLGPDLEMEAYQGAKKELEALQKAGEGEGDRAKQLDNIVTRFIPKRGGYVYIVEPNSPVVKALKVSAQVLNQLFGKEETSYTAAVVSVVDEMKKRNQSPFDLNNESGWLKIYKTGQGLATRYYVLPMEEDITVTVEGTALQAKRPLKAKVHDKILSSNVTLDDIPNPLEMEKKNAFTPEETVQFITEMRIPDRFLNRDKAPGGQVQVLSDSEALDKLSNLDSFAGDGFM